ncbi:hypothetical protein AMATHDRAFT_63185 [Amanita thiersii Skay4041]|uniref:Uncharacterized protein n=1 Tax=Amanita thiersii Skay4041 TaxID=703135 RepID=A0A2A9NJD5_9AGAR|nr:hypothetical protein AMATHDRAFT_63185 [Amanita thiersii Skay4041]
MAIFYPDNNNRGKRVEELASDIQHLQEQTKQLVDETTEHDKKAAAYLNEVLKARSKTTLDEFIKKNEAVMDQEYLKELQHLAEEVKDLDDRVNLALKVGSGMFCLGVTLSLSATVLRMFLQRQFLVVGVRSLSLGVMRMLGGEFEAGIKLVRAAGKMFSKFFRGGEEIVGKAATAFRVLKLFGKFLVIAGVVIDIVTFSIDLAEEKKQRSDLQAANRELCVSRFQVKKLQMQTSITASHSSDARATLSTSATLYEFVGQGLLTKEVVDNKVKDKLDEWITKGMVIDGVKQPSLDEQLKAITDDAVYANLFKFDKDRDSWMYEDPNLSYIVTELEKKAKAEKEKAEKEGK